jgi:hypothetical protein
MRRVSRSDAIAMARVDCLARDARETGGHRLLQCDVVDVQLKDAVDFLRDARPAVRNEGPRRA